MPTNLPLEYAPAADQTGKPLYPGDKVSFKLYPRGTARGTVQIHPYGLEEVNGRRLPTLCIIDEEDRRYPLLSGGVRKLKDQS